MEWMNTAEPRLRWKKNSVNYTVYGVWGFAKEIVEKQSIKQRMQFIAFFAVALKIIIKQRNEMNVRSSSNGCERENGIQI